jgi:Mn2+/Fe2+ NRAMP family transporter
MLKSKLATKAESDVLSAEDRVRAEDRGRVLAARRRRSRLRLLWLLIGPGILVMLGENDGPSMISYATSGAAYGIGFFLPFIVVTFLAATVVQEMAMRVGAVTHRGYGELVFQRYGHFWGWLSAGDLLLTNFLTLVTEFIAIRVGLGFFGVPAPIGVALAVGLVAFSLGGGRYWRWERAALGLAAFNLLFVLAAVMVRPSPGSIGHALATWSPLPSGSLQTFLLLLVSNIGATITPWMVFFQQSAVVDKGMTPKDLPQGRIDIVVGGLLAATAGCGALVAASVLFAHHVDLATLRGGAGFPEALRRAAGYPVAAVFALGLVEAGALAALTISASTGYAIGEALATGHSFNRRVQDAPVFYLLMLAIAVVAGGVVRIPGAPLLAITLNANLFATALLPAALVFLIMLANDGELMGTRVNGRLLNVVASLVVVCVAVAAASYALVSSIAALTGSGG